MESVFVNGTFKSWVFRLRAKVDTFNVSSEAYLSPLCQGKKI